MQSLEAGGKDPVSRENSMRQEEEENGWSIVSK